VLKLVEHSTIAFIPAKRHVSHRLRQEDHLTNTAPVIHASSALQLGTFEPLNLLVHDVQMLCIVTVLCLGHVALVIERWWVQLLTLPLLCKNSVQCSLVLSRWPVVLCSWYGKQ